MFTDSFFLLFCFCFFFPRFFLLSHLHKVVRRASAVCICGVHRSNEDFVSYLNIVHAHAAVILGGEKCEIIASLITQGALHQTLFTVSLLVWQVILMLSSNGKTRDRATMTCQSS